MNKFKLLLIMAFSFLNIGICASFETDSTNKNLHHILEASKKIKEIDPSAFLIYQEGRLASYEYLDHPSQTNHWSYSAVTNNEDESNKYWSMDYNDAILWQIEEHIIPPYDISFTNCLLCVSMDVNEAWEIVKEAGYSEPIAFWALFHSLHPDSENAVYVFKLSYSGYIVVDTVTGEVWIEV